MGNALSPQTSGPFIPTLLCVKNVRSRSTYGLLRPAGLGGGLSGLSVGGVLLRLLLDDVGLLVHAEAAIVLGPLCAVVRLT